MPFLIDTDYRALVKDNILLDIIENDTPTRQRAELMAQAEMEGYLTARYDTAAIFSAVDPDRSEVIIMYLIDLTLYHLHSRISPQQVPELRKERYKVAIDWLKMVQAQKVNPDLPVPTEEGAKEEVQYGSNTARRNHW